jgi:fibronectin type 3 domain-containing protein
MRDDGPIGFSDGTSYTDPGRIPGQSNTYSVTAIDAEGTRSETAQIILASFGQCDFSVTGLRADVYSDTAAELFWIRTPGRTVTYEIVRDDGMSWHSAGTSFLDGSRTPGLVNTYSVTAINEENACSPTVTISVGSFTTSNTTVTGLRGSVYSSVSAEIFWDRVNNRSLRYEILRDDGAENVTNGSSFYDNHRVPGMANTYHITTIDEQGNRSAPALITLPAF